MSKKTIEYAKKLVSQMTIDEKIRVGNVFRRFPRLLVSWVLAAFRY